MKASKAKSTAKPTAKRSYKAGCLLNEEEHALLCFYMKKYKIANRSRWFRETIIAHILRSLDRDHPTLFDENEMRR